MGEWRESFRDWLQRCYDEPIHYLDSHGNPYSDGQPDRPDSPELTQHNGLVGVDQNPHCADRRAWTWEVRFLDQIEFKYVCVLHVPHDQMNKAQKLADQIESVSKRPVEIKILPPGVAASAREIYRDSGRVLREMVGL